MNRLVPLVLVNVLLLFGVLTSAAQSTNRSGVKEFEEAEFKALIDRYYAAWSTLRTENAAPFYAKDANLVFFDFAPLQYKGWNEYQEGVKKNFFDKMSGGKVTPNNDLRVTRRGNIAWTTLTEHFSTTLKDGRTIEIEGRHTAIWEKRNSKWLIVHEHVSAPLPPL